MDAELLYGGVAQLTEEANNFAVCAVRVCPDEWSAVDRTGDRRVGATSVECHAKQLVLSSLVPHQGGLPNARVV